MCTVKRENAWYRVEKELDENGNPIHRNVYPTVKAIMQHCLCTKEIREFIEIGAKYDEAYFENILAELRMEGRVSPIFNEDNDEVVAWRFESYEI
jgi:hypothetical protein